MMHQLMLGLNVSEVPDHINHNTLDNRLFNLRPANRKQSAAYRRKAEGKSSCFLGVSWSQREQMWRARITHYERTLELGFFQLEEDAARERDLVAIKLHFGVFAVLNFPRNGILLTPCSWVHSSWDSHVWGKNQRIATILNLAISAGDL